MSLIQDLSWPGITSICISIWEGLTIILWFYWEKKKVWSSKLHSWFQARVYKLYLISDQNCQNVNFISDRNRSKTISFDATSEYPCSWAYHSQRGASMFSTTKEQNRSFCLYCFLIISNNQRLIRGSREVNKDTSSRLSDDSIVAGAGGVHRQGDLY